MSGVTEIVRYAVKNRIVEDFGHNFFFGAQFRSRKFWRIGSQNAGFRSQGVGVQLWVLYYCQGGEPRF